MAICKPARQSHWAWVDTLQRLCLAPLGSGLCSPGRHLAHARPPCTPAELAHADQPRFAVSNFQNSTWPRWATAGQPRVAPWDWGADTGEALSRDPRSPRTGPKPSPESDRAAAPSPAVPTGPLLSSVHTSSLLLKWWRGRSRGWRSWCTPHAQQGQTGLFSSLSSPSVGSFFSTCSPRLRVGRATQSLQHAARALHRPQLLTRGRPSRP